MKKALLICGIVLVVLILLIAVAVGVYLGPIVKFGIQEIGPQVTHVSINVGSVDLSLFTGSATIKDLKVGNPQGFKAPEAFSVGTITVRMDPFSVVSPVIMVHSVVIKSPEITYENGKGGNNLNRLVANMSASQNGPAEKENNKAAANNKPASKIEVDDLLVTGAKVHVMLPGIGAKAIFLPDIHLTDLGKTSGGLTPVELGSQVLSAITRDTVSFVGASVSELLKGGKLLGNDTVVTVSKSFSKITGSLGGLLGK
jgi:hypothetical protein